MVSPAVRGRYMVPIVGSKFYLFYLFLLLGIMQHCVILDDVLTGPRVIVLTILDRHPIAC